MNRSFWMQMPAHSLLEQFRSSLEWCRKASYLRQPEVLMSRSQLLRDQERVVDCSSFSEPLSPPSYRPQVYDQDRLRRSSAAACILAPVGQQARWVGNLEEYENAFDIVQHPGVRHGKRRCHVQTPLSKSRISIQSHDGQTFVGNQKHSHAK